jgi:hypothetical protein
VGATHYDALMSLILARVNEFDVSYETVNFVSGMQSGYFQKLACSPPLKRAARLLCLTCSTRSVSKLRLVESPLKMARVQSRLTKRKKAPTAKPASARIIQITPDHMRQITRSGGFARAQALTPKQRSASARHAAKARWERHRQREQVISRGRRKWGQLMLKSRKRRRAERINGRGTDQQLCAPELATS